LHAAAVEIDAREVRFHLRWQPRPWLLSLALVALAPAAVLWAAALADTLGITHMLSGLPIPAAATSRPERLLLLGTFLSAMLVLPLVAVLSGVLATIAFELQVADWEITARLRLPVPPWTLPQLVAGTLLVLGALLFLAMAGHLAADCLFGTDCMSG